MTKIGLALGGGGARGLTHIHVIAAIEELGLDINAISGSSIGALIGAGYAAGMDSRQLEDYFLARFSKPMDVLSRFWSLKPTSIKELWQRGVKLSQFNLEIILDGFLPDIIPQDFSALKRPFCAVAADLTAAEVVEMKGGALRSAIAASAAIPGLFKPVLRDGKLLVDGGVCNPVPFDCMPSPVDKVIGVDVVGFSGEKFDNHFPSTIESLLAASLVSQQALIRARLIAKHIDLLLRPPVNGIYVLDFLKAKDILVRTAFYKEDAKKEIAAMMEKTD